MRHKKLLIGMAATVAAVGLGGGAAFAAWSVSGTGSGAGAATVAQSLVVTPVTPAGAGATLYPGGPAGPVFFNIQNPNPYAVTITGLAWGTPTSTNTSSCASTNISLDAGAPTTVSISVPAASTASDVQVNSVLDLSHSAGNGCQGVAFDIPVTVTGAQQ
ncbi:MAG TPA: hypothetical protein VGP46_09875 [Acidimicrobiales bacterium]|jgi:hypothetical protein|nr:hypothetical protein [Acidimicrobiales bacterium]